MTARLTDQLDFPYLLLLVSGGHSQILIVKDVGSYKLLGTTLDDAVGEAFDKIAKLLGIDMPGGPNLENLLSEVILKNIVSLDLCWQTRLQFFFIWLEDRCSI